jgi:hypothetical protein
VTRPVWIPSRTNPNCRRHVHPSQRPAPYVCKHYQVTNYTIAYERRDPIFARHTHRHVAVCVPLGGFFLPGSEAVRRVSFFSQPLTTAAQVETEAGHKSWRITPPVAVIAVTLSSQEPSSFSPADSHYITAARHIESTTKTEHTLTLLSTN